MADRLRATALETDLIRIKNELMDLKSKADGMRDYRLVYKINSALIELNLGWDGSESKAILDVRRIKL